jgi:hypothetical protein
MGDKDKKLIVPILAQYNAALGVYVPIDSQGLIYERGRLESILKEVNKFYAIYDDKTIKQKNEERENTQQIALQETDKSPKKGYVYFIKAENGLTKIGETKRLAHRVRAIRHSSLINIQLLFAAQTDNAPATEEYLHTKYAPKRKRGEWFALTEDDIKNAKRDLKRRGHFVLEGGLLDGQGI